MIRYLALLAAFSLMITVVCRCFRRHLPVNMRVVYITIGTSFFITAFFPMVLASFQMSGALLIYGAALLLLAFGLSRLQERLACGHQASDEPERQLLPVGLSGGEDDPEGPDGAALTGRPGLKRYLRSWPEAVFRGLWQAALETAAAGDRRESEDNPEPAEVQPVEEFPGYARGRPEAVVPAGTEEAGAEEPGTGDAAAAAAPAMMPAEVTPTVEVESGEEEKPPVPAVRIGVAGLPAPIAAGVTVPKGSGVTLHLTARTPSCGENGDASPHLFEDSSGLPAPGGGLVAEGGETEAVAGGSPVNAPGSGEPAAADGGQEAEAALHAGSEGGVAGSEMPVATEAGKQVGSEVTSTVNNYITRGFAARDKGNFVEAVECFLKALLSSPGEQLKALLALEIGAVYQQLGQYRQAVMLLETVLAPGSGIRDRALRQQLYARKVYLEMIAELLKTARQPNTPYAAIPSLIKVKAGVETAERLKLKRKGERAFEKFEGDSQAAGLER